MWSPPVSQFPIGDTQATIMERSKSAHDVLDRSRGEDVLRVLCICGRGGDCAAAAEPFPFPMYVISSSLSYSLPSSHSELSSCFAAPAARLLEAALRPESPLDVRDRWEGPACAIRVDIVVQKR